MPDIRLSQVLRLRLVSGPRWAGLFSSFRLPGLVRLVIVCLLVCLLVSLLHEPAASWLFKSEFFFFFFFLLGTEVVWSPVINLLSACFAI